MSNIQNKSGTIPSCNVTSFNQLTPTITTFIVHVLNLAYVARQHRLRHSLRQSCTAIGVCLSSLAVTLCKLRLTLHINLFYRARFKAVYSDHKNTLLFASKRGKNFPLSHPNRHCHSRLFLREVRMTFRPKPSNNNIGLHISISPCIVTSEAVVNFAPRIYSLFIASPPGSLRTALNLSSDVSRL